MPREFTPHRAFRLTWPPRFARQPGGWSRPPPELILPDSILSLAPPGLGQQSRKSLADAEVRGALLTAFSRGPDADATLRVWWPRGLPAGRRVAIISSRLERDRGRHRLWFQALRTFVAQCGPAELLLSAEGSTAAPWIERLAHHTGHRRAVLHLPAPRLSRRRWFEQLAHSTSHADPALWPCYLVPATCQGERSPPCGASRPDATPLADRWLLATAELLLVLRLRRGSRLLPALRADLDHARRGRRMVVAVGPGLVAEPDAAALLARGAEVWPFVPQQGSRAPDVQVGDALTAPCAALLEQPPAGTYLLHCTRHRDGPWPGQATEDYLDDLLLQRPGADHTPRAALQHILAEQRIAASSAGIRGGTLVVCFTAAGLHQLVNLRTYRAHRVRWDFCPYGIAIEARWLAERGARPVLYGQDSDWAALPAEQRPFFQRATSGHRAHTTGARIDWSSEQEWRHCGDVRLAELRADQAYLFVPSQADAEELAPHSRWPIVIVRTNGHS